MNDNDVVGWMRTPKGARMIHRDDEELAGPASRHPSACDRELSLPPLRVVRD